MKKKTRMKTYLRQYKEPVSGGHLEFFEVLAYVFQSSGGQMDFNVNL